MDAVAYLKFLAALVFVLSLIGVLAYIARRYGWFRLVAGVRTGHRRLSVVETLVVDPRHRLILVRRDNVEYLLLVGTSSRLIERIDRSEEAKGP